MRSKKGRGVWEGSKLADSRGNRSRVAALVVAKFAWVLFAGEAEVKRGSKWGSEFREALRSEARGIASGSSAASEAGLSVLENSRTVATPWTPILG